MGAYAPVSHIDEAHRTEAIEKIIKPVTKGMAEEGLDYFRILYLGAIVTAEGVKVIEFNARFGDPEAQILPSMMEDDLGEVVEKVHQQEPFELSFIPGCMVGVVLARRGYTKSYEKEKYVELDTSRENCDIGGLRQDIEGLYMTSGGMVLLVTGY